MHDHRAAARRSITAFRVPRRSSAGRPRRLRTPLAIVAALALAAGVALPASAAPATDTSTIGGLRPADIASAYGLSGGTAGGTVGVVIPYDNPNLESDLGVYRSTWGLPACTTANGCFRVVSQRGGSDLPRADSDWGLETALDVDAVSAACPDCHVLVVEADGETMTALGTAENTAVRLGATAVTNSWTVPESSSAASISSTYFTHPGVPMLAATGDAGYRAAQMPASLPNVIAVGGTTLNRTSASPAAVRRGDPDAPLLVDDGQAIPAASASQIELDQLAVSQAMDDLAAATDEVTARTNDVTDARAAAAAATSAHIAAVAADTATKRILTTARTADRAATSTERTVRHALAVATTRLHATRLHHGSTKAIHHATTAVRRATTRLRTATHAAGKAATALHTAETRAAAAAAQAAAALAAITVADTALQTALDALDEANDDLDDATAALADARATLLADQQDQDETDAQPTPTTAPQSGSTASAGPAARGWTETAWSLGGSGCSTQISRPSWQSANACGSTRSVADVAAVGDPQTGLAVYDSYGTTSQGGPWLMVGGTSLATPLVAGMLVRSGHAANYSNAAPLYATPSAFTDITSGSTGGTGGCGGDSRCTAGTGYDGPTGVGTPTSLASF